MPYPRPKPPAGGVKAPFPGFIAPALATSIGKVPSGDRWIHEVKFDGYRVQVHLRDATVKVFTRRGNDWTNRFKKIAAPHRKRSCCERWLGGRKPDQHRTF
jgi:bifunctional non-homologous end joining protein LigD